MIIQHLREERRGRWKGLSERRREEERWQRQTGAQIREGLMCTYTGVGKDNTM